MSNNYNWQGKPVEVEFGWVRVSENKEKPLFWYNYECSEMNRGWALIHAIKVSQHGQTWYMANHAGIGVHKLLNGGWPSHTHFSLEGKFTPYGASEWELYKIIMTKFHEKEYAAHEAKREQWQAKNYPDQYEEMRKLKQIIKRNL